MRMHIPKALLTPIIPITPEMLLKTKTEAEAAYKAIPEVECPYLKGKVAFNSEGFEHLRFKEWNKERLPYQQYLRLKYSYLAPQILLKSHTLQGFWDTKGWVRQKSHGKWIKSLEHIKYYEFIGVIGKARFKVIVKQVNENQMIFWSLIPFWKMADLKDGKIRRERILHDDDPETS